MSKDRAFQSNDTDAQELTNMLKNLRASLNSSAMSDSEKARFRSKTIMEAMRIWFADGCAYTSLAPMLEKIKAEIMDADFSDDPELDEMQTALRNSINAFLQERY